MERPNGSQATTFGWVLIVVGVLALIAGSTSDALEGMIWGAVIANLGIGLGIILVSLGYLVRAIWFLPGREEEIEKLEELKTALRADTRADRDFEICEWCDLKVYSPNIVCASQSVEDLKAELELVDLDEIPSACRNQLISKGLF